MTILMVTRALLKWLTLQIALSSSWHRDLLPPTYRLLVYWNITRYHGTLYYIKLVLCHLLLRFVFIENSIESLLK